MARQSEVYIQGLGELLRDFNRLPKDAAKETWACKPRPDALARPLRRPGKRLKNPRRMQVQRGFFFGRQETPAYKATRCSLVDHHAGKHLANGPRCRRRQVAALVLDADRAGQLELRRVGAAQLGRPDPTCQGRPGATRSPPAMPPSSKRPCPAPPESGCADPPAGRRATRPLAPERPWSSAACRGF